MPVSPPALGKCDTCKDQLLEVVGRAGNKYPACPTCMAHKLEVAESEEYKNAPYEMDIIFKSGVRLHQQNPARFNTVPPPDVWASKEKREKWIAENIVPQFRLREK